LFIVQCIDPLLKRGIVKKDAKMARDRRRDGLRDQGS